MSIKPLPGDVVAQIKSSAVITSLNNVICGLIKNSLDAQATKINISVDFSRGNCSIEDNGNGIVSSEFNEDGGLGRLHYTSKYPLNANIHGRNGVFLASVASLSLLSIASHHREFHSHNSMSIHNSQVLVRHTPCLPEQRLLTFSHGTRVTVRDLFGSMPVRVKHRALQAEKSTFARDWDRLLLDVAALLIAWHGTVSVSIREASGRQAVTLKTDPQFQQWINDSCRILHHASLCNSPDPNDWVAIGASAPTLSVNGYVCREPVATKRVQFISLGIEPLSNEYRSNILYEEVNKIFADSDFGAVEDDDEADDIPKQVKIDGLTNREPKARKGVDRWPMFFLKISPASSATEVLMGVDDILDDGHPSLILITDLLKAIFYEFLKKIHCRPKGITLSTKSKSHHKKGDIISSRSVEAVSTPPPAFSQKVTQNIGQSSTTNLVDGLARKTTRLDTAGTSYESPFAAWSKTKSGLPLQTFKASATPRSQTQTASTVPTHRNENTTPEYSGTERSISLAVESPPPPLYDDNGKLTRKPFKDDWRGAITKSSTRDKGPEKLQLLPQNSPNPDNTFEWIDPATEMAVTVNSRTGFSVVPKPLTLSRRFSKHIDVQPGSDATTSDGSIQDTTSWIRDLANNWENPVFKSTEEPIPKLSGIAEILNVDLKPVGHQCHHGKAYFNMPTRYERSTMSLKGRLSKDALRKAEIIAQVDTKFIFAKVSLDDHKKDSADRFEAMSSSSVLLLIDQHAADERCRVEALMADYFRQTTDNKGNPFWEAVTELLPKPVQFELSNEDKDLLLRYQQYFMYWGIVYGMDDTIPAQLAEIPLSRKRSTSTRGKVVVRGLPPAIIERCRSEPRLLAELIRKEAWRLKDEDVPFQQPSVRPVLADDVNGSVPVWVSLLHGCPQGIVDLINSRSCRSAIMFNDPLTFHECTELLKRLMRCVFPFQCAHGRPSMVPLVNLGDFSTHLGNLAADSGKVQNEEAFGRIFNKWKQRRT